MSFNSKAWLLTVAALKTVVKSTHAYNYREAHRFNHLVLPLMIAARLDSILISMNKYVKLQSRNCVSVWENNYLNIIRVGKLASDTKILI